MEAKLQQQTPQKAPASTPNLTGIPTQMKLDFERRSGLSFDDVRVHYNSDKPAQLQALAYTQGTQVYVGPGQERHLKHELGHVVQQKRGIVRPTRYVSGLPLNDSLKMEYLADQWGGVTKTMAIQTNKSVVQRQRTNAEDMTTIDVLIHGKKVTIDFKKIKREILGTFTAKGYKTEQEIYDIWNNLQFNEVEGTPTHEYDEASRKHTINYCTNYDIYEKIPDMKEDFYDEQSPNAQEDFFIKSFTCTVIHEFGHAIQRTLFPRYDPLNIGIELNEHHNVLFHENLYSGRKRGSYNPLSMTKNLISMDPAWDLVSTRKSQKELMLKLAKSENIDRENLVKILDVIDELLHSTQKPYSLTNQRQVVLTEILTELREQPTLGERESDYIKSLIISLMLNSQSYAWFNQTFNKIMDKIPKELLDSEKTVPNK